MSETDATPPDDPGDQSSLVTNALLGYVFNCMHFSSVYNLRAVVLGHFSADAIHEAKETLAQHVASSVVGEAFFTTRRGSSARGKAKARTGKAKEKEEMELDDIIEAMEAMDKAGVSVEFHIPAFELHLLPRTRPEDLLSVTFMETYSVALQKNSDGGTAIPWTKVRKTRKSRPINRTDVKNATQQLRTVTGKSACDSELVGSMPAKHIYVSKLNTDITSDHISDYMRKKNIHVRQTRKVSKDEWLHGSFKVAINAEDLERVLDEEFWPERELWLHSSEGHRITESLSNVSMHFVSGMPDDEIHVGRPYGGCCIIWNSKLKCKVSPLPCSNSRVCAIKIDLSDGPLLLINAYMPCDTQVAYHDNQLVFEEVLNDVADLIQISNIDRIVFGGDFNTALSWRASTHTRSLNQFVTNESLSFLSALSCYEVDYTHESDAHGTRSTLDHFIVSSQLVCSVNRVQCDHNALSSSDHTALLLSLSISMPSISNGQSVPRRGPVPLWPKATDAHIANYRNSLSESTEDLTPPYEALRCDSPQCTAHTETILSYCNALISLCLSSDRRSIPHSPVSRSVCNDVDVEIQLLCRNVRFLRSLERSNNRVVRCCFQLVQNDSRSTVSRSFSKLCDVTQKSRHHIVESVCHPTALFEISNDHEEIAGFIRDLLALKAELKLDQNLNARDIEFLRDIVFSIQELCTA
ncbi:hypothetical protein CAPTEDRAFT_205906 [Capitella teleta]|uniref:Endonuclease/exonuclease/phosphatase domain-containing protein n=1 Tax=Capitella teleta TaxID=283909 RepID=R7URC9_CAPTE|nr:hypothetical protein CAPTEDRAFT_205906 [Capitella teleta]|eukprot:ELU08678.1 hypothetical protein CAPTEDRAFT_205906 [Capitella teleta]